MKDENGENVSSMKSTKEKFEVLASAVGKLPDQEIVDTALNLLVNAKFDLEAAFIIERLVYRGLKMTHIYDQPKN